MDKVLEVDAVSQAARIQGGIYGPAIEDAAARHALHHAPLHAGLSLLDPGRLDRHALGRPLRHALHPYRRLRREHAGRDAGRHARDAPPAGLRRRPQPRPHVHRLRGHPRHHHRSLGAAAQEADVPRLRLACASRTSSPAPMRCATSPRPASIPPTAGCSRRARRCPAFRGATRRRVLVLAFESADHPLDAWMKRALEICARPWRRGRAAAPTTRTPIAPAPPAPGATSSSARRTTASMRWRAASSPRPSRRR